MTERRILHDRDLTRALLQRVQLRLTSLVQKSHRKATSRTFQELEFGRFLSRR